MIDKPNDLVLDYSVASDLLFPTLDAEEILNDTAVIYGLKDKIVGVSSRGSVRWKESLPDFPIDVVMQYPQDTHFYLTYPESVSTITRYNEKHEQVATRQLPSSGVPSSRSLGIESISGHIAVGTDCRDVDLTHAGLVVLDEFCNILASFEDVRYASSPVYFNDRRIYYIDENGNIRVKHETEATIWNSSPWIDFSQTAYADFKAVDLLPSTDQWYLIAVGEDSLLRIDGFSGEILDSTSIPGGYNECAIQENILYISYSSPFKYITVNTLVEYEIIDEEGKPYERNLLPIPPFQENLVSDFISGKINGRQVLPYKDGVLLDLIHGSKCSVVYWDGVTLTYLYTEEDHFNRLLVAPSFKVDAPKTGMFVLPISLYDDMHPKVPVSDSYYPAPEGYRYSFWDEQYIISYEDNAIEDRFHEPLAGLEALDTHGNNREALKVPIDIITDGQGNSVTRNLIAVRRLLPSTEYTLRFYHYYYNPLTGVEVKGFLSPPYTFSTIARDTQAPSEVTDVTYTAENNIITVSWTNPSDPDFAAVIVTLNDEEPVEIFTSSISFSDLPLGSVHTIRIQTRDNNYFHYRDDEKNIKDFNVSEGVLLENIEVTDTEPPPAPTNLVVQPGDNTLLLSWNPVISDDFSHYNVYTTNTISPLVVGITDLSFLFDGLTNDQTYEIGVSSVDTAGNESAISRISSTPTDTINPEPPSNLVLTPINEGITASWDHSIAPDLFNYQVILRENGNSIAIEDQSTTGTTYTFTGLTYGVDYEIIVRAKDDDNLHSTIISGVTSPLDTVAPTSAYQVTYTVTHNSITLNWIDSVSPDFDHIQIVVTGGETITVAPGIQTATLTGLIPGTQYIVSVYAVDAAGNTSNPVIVRPTTDPPLLPVDPPTALTATPDVTTCELSWTDASSNINYYAIEVDGVEVAQVSQGVGAYTVTGLIAETAYVFGVISVSTQGVTNGVTVNATTLSAAPSLPESSTVTSIGSVYVGDSSSLMRYELSQTGGTYTANKTLEKTGQNYDTNYLSTDVDPIGDMWLGLERSTSVTLNRVPGTGSSSNLLVLDYSLSTYLTMERYICAGSSVVFVMLRDGADSTVGDITGFLLRESVPNPANFLFKVRVPYGTGFFSKHNPYRPDSCLYIVEQGASDVLLVRVLEDGTSIQNTITGSYGGYYLMTEPVALPNGWGFIGVAASNNAGYFVTVNENLQLVGETYLTEDGFSTYSPVYDPDHSSFYFNYSDVDGNKVGRLFGGSVQLKAIPGHTYFDEFSISHQPNPVDNRILFIDTDGLALHQFDFESGTTRKIIDLLYDDSSSGWFYKLAMPKTLAPSATQTSLTGIINSSTPQSDYVVTDLSFGCRNAIAIWDPYQDKFYSTNVYNGSAYVDGFVYSPTQGQLAETSIKGLDSNGAATSGWYRNGIFYYGGGWSGNGSLYKSTISQLSWTNRAKTHIDMGSAGGDYPAPRRQGVYCPDEEFNYVMSVGDYDSAHAFKIDKVNYYTGDPEYQEITSGFYEDLYPAAGLVYQGDFYIVDMGVTGYSKFGKFNVDTKILTPLQNLPIDLQRAYMWHYNGDFYLYAMGNPQVGIIYKYVLGTDTWSLVTDQLAPVSFPVVGLRHGGKEIWIFGGIDVNTLEHVPTVEVYVLE